MNIFKLTTWSGQEPVRELIDREEAERLITARREHGPIYLSTRPRLDGKVEVQVALTWGDLYSDWLSRERGSWASWDGPQCSYGYFSTYVYPEAGYEGEAVPGRFKTIYHHLPKMAVEH